MANEFLKSNKRQSVTRFLIICGIIILLNIISHFYYHRFDLTKDKRFSLGKASKTLIKSLDDVVYVKVYLDGDLPAGFRRLREATKELLDEYKAYAGKKIEYEFFDPSESKVKEERYNTYKQLMNEGLEPVNLEVKEENDQKTEKIIFPGAIVTYKNKSLPLSLLQQQLMISPEEVIHNSIISLEYEFSNTIRKLQIGKIPRIAFIVGHGEADAMSTFDIYKSLSQYYEVVRLNLPYSRIEVLKNFDAIVVVKPDSQFHELEKYEIDQFIMNGGRSLWFVETLLADIDSMKENGIMLTMDYPLNLNDMFFKYGFKVNYNIVEDINCQYIPLLTPNQSGGSKRDFRLWPYYPLVFSTSSHPIVNNLNAIWFRFANSIDTVYSPGIKKTILLQSSAQSRLKMHPVKISLDHIREVDYPAIFNKEPQILALLLEGTFTSLFRNRPIPPAIPMELQKKFMEKSKPDKMIIVSDGDVIMNDVSHTQETYYPLGFDHYTNQTFGNKTFVLNCVDYLLDESNLMQLRTKYFKLRLLDKAKYKGKEIKWQVINLVIPVLVVLLFGFIFIYVRKIKHSKT